MHIRDKVFARLSDAESMMSEYEQEVRYIAVDYPQNWLINWISFELYLVQRHLALLVEMFEKFTEGEEDEGGRKPND